MSSGRIGALQLRPMEVEDCDIPLEKSRFVTRKLLCPCTHGRQRKVCVSTAIGDILGNVIRDAAMLADETNRHSWWFLSGQHTLSGNNSRRHRNMTRAHWCPVHRLALYCMSAYLNPSNPNSEPVEIRQDLNHSHTTVYNRLLVCLIESVDLLWTPAVLLDVLRLLCGQIRSKLVCDKSGLAWRTNPGIKHGRVDGKD